jgi:hypothetical protein
MSDEAHRDFLLSALRGASLRAKMWETEINTIGIALKADMITVAQAMKWIRDVGALELIGEIPAIVTEAERSIGALVGDQS